MPRVAHNLVWCIVHNSIIIIFIIVIYNSITKCEWYSGVSYFDANIWSHHKRVGEAQGTKQLISSHEKGLSLLKIAIILSFISLLLSPCMEIVHPSGLGHFWTPSRVFEFRELNFQSELSKLHSPILTRGAEASYWKFSVLCCANCAILVVVCFAKQNGCEITGNVRLDWRKASQPWVE